MSQIKGQPSQLEITEEEDLDYRLILSLWIKKVDHLLWLTRILKAPQPICDPSQSL